MLLNHKQFAWLHSRFSVRNSHNGRLTAQTNASVLMTKRNLSKRAMIKYFSVVKVVQPKKKMKAGLVT